MVHTRHSSYSKDLPQDFLKINGHKKDGRLSGSVENAVTEDSNSTVQQEEEGQHQLSEQSQKHQNHEEKQNVRTK